MTLPVVYWGGGEDSEFYQVGGNFVSTLVNSFRSTYARCSLSVQQSNTPGINFWQNWLQYSLSSFWWTGRSIILSVNAPESGGILLQWVDTNNIVRLQLVAVSANTWAFYKVDHLGAATQLGSNFSMICSLNEQDKFDLQFVCNATGTCNFYLNGIQYFAFSGDTTTDSVTTICGHRLGNEQSKTSGSTRYWSEITVGDSDTRSWNLQTLPPVANGNTHNFDIGSPQASNVNEIFLDDSTLDGSDTAGQIDQYTIPAIAPGTYSILAIIVSARMQRGLSGLSKMDIGVRSGSTDYWSSDQSLTTAWTDYQNVWNTDPNTTAAWAALPINIGLKSVT